MRQLFSRLLVLALLVLACSGAVWGDNLKVNITTSVGIITETGRSSLGEVLSSYTLSEVEGIEVIAGKFETADWYWLRNNRKDLKNLKKFVVTDGVESVADIPDTYWNGTYFGNALEELRVAKLNAVGEDAFRTCFGLTSVSLPSTTKIGREAFYRCEKLTLVSLPNATDIGGEAFGWCENLTSVSLPAATEIGKDAFYGCTSLTSVSLPSATKIGKQAFWYCGKLQLVSLPNATDIGGEAFGWCKNLTGVSLPAATNIGDSAFYVCKSLTSVSLPAATNIGGEAFSGCENLKSVSLPAATEIGKSAFLGCKNLTSVSLPAVTKIDNYAFDGCTSLKALKLGATPPTSVGADAFSGCLVARELELINPDGTALTGSALDNTKSLYKAANDGDTEDNLWYGWAFEEFPASNLSGAIDGVAFTNAASLEAAMQGKDLSNIKELTITGGTFQISDLGFLQEQGKDKLKIEQFTIENSVESVADIPDLSYESPRFLPSAQIVRIAKVQKVGDHAFRDCTSLTSVSLPAATEIGKSAFLGCKNLTSVSLPKVFDIANGAFVGCTSLKTLKLGATPPTSVGSFGVRPLARELELINPDGTALTGSALDNAKSLYKAVNDGDTEDNLWYGWAFEEFPASNLSGTIDGVAFTNAASLEAAMQGKTLGNVKELTITGGAFQVPDWGFLLEQGQDKLKIEQFTIENSATKVADMPDLTWLSPTYLPKAKSISIAKLERVAAYAFQGCKSLTSVSLPAATEIGQNAFESCEKLTSVSLPAATNIGAVAFSDCTSLTSVSLPMASKVSLSVFWGCTSLTSVSLPMASKVSLSVFWGCTSLTSVSLPAATEIGKDAFYGCTSLTSVSLPAAIAIGEDAFKSCEKLTSVSLPAAKTIDSWAFSGCTSLKALKLGTTPPTSVNAMAFSGCPSERTLIITDAAGVPLVGQELKAAADNYDGKEGDPHDGKWYGWAIEKNPPTMLSVIVEPAGAGTAKITSKDGGAVVNEGDKLTKDEVLVIDAKPNDEHQYKLKEVTAKGATNTSGNEWMVTANPGEQVVFTVEFEKAQEENNNSNPTPVESALLAQAQLSPNPTDGQVTIDAGTTLARCEVYSSTGALLQAIESPKRVFTIDLSASPSGVYLVRLVDVNGESKTLRAVKQ